MPKLTESVTIRVSEHELRMLRRIAEDYDITLSEMLRSCISIGLPVYKDLYLARKIDLTDNISLKEPRNQ